MHNIGTNIFLFILNRCVGTLFSLLRMVSIVVVFHTSCPKGFPRIVQVRKVVLVDLLSVSFLFQMNVNNIFSLHQQQKMAEIVH